MTTAGIDAGNKNTRVVLLRDGAVAVKASGPSGFDQDAAARSLLDQALGEAGLGPAEVAHLTVTGAGRNAVTFGDSRVTTVTAAARGANYWFPGAATVIEVGAEVSHALRVDGRGKVIDSAMNDKCAAGSGSFTESMARALGLTLEAFSQAGLESSAKLPINAQCTVFAESEVVSLIHSGTRVQDIARAVNDAIASRIAAMARPLKGAGPVVVLGGLAHNRGFLRCLEEHLGVTGLEIPPDPEFTDAVGAAVIAAERAA